MSKIRNFIFNFFKLLYFVFPFKRSFCFIIKYLKIPNNRFYKYLKFRGQFEVETIPNKSIKLIHYGGSIENEIFWKGLFNTWESETGWIWAQLCQCSNIIFDVGANTGVYSLIAKKLNPEAEVYAFEPSINTYNKLLKNNQINDLNIRSFQFAISNSQGKATFYDVPNENQTSASLSPNMLKNSTHYKGRILEYEVPTITLSALIEQYKLPKLDLIKIDVEMHEPEVLEGLGEYLLRYKPIIILEVLTEDIALKLNKKFSNDFIFLYLEKKNQTRRVDFIFSDRPWNFLIFHKDLEEKLKRYTTLSY